MKPIDLEIIRIAKTLDKYKGNTPLEQISSISRTITPLINSLFEDNTTEVERLLGELHMDILLLSDMLMVDPYTGSLDTDYFSFDTDIYKDATSATILRDVIVALGNLSVSLAEAPDDILEHEKSLWTICILLDLFASSQYLSTISCKYLIAEYYNGC